MRAFNRFLAGALVHVMAMLVALAFTQHTQVLHYRSNIAAVESVAEAEQVLPEAYALLDSTLCHTLLSTADDVSRIVTLWPIQFISGLLPEVEGAILSASQLGLSVVAVAPLRGHRIFLSPAFFNQRRLWAASLAHEILHSVYGWDDQELKLLLCPTDTTEGTHCITIEIQKGCPTMGDLPKAEPIKSLDSETA